MRFPKASHKTCDAIQLHKLDNKLHILMQQKYFLLTIRLLLTNNRLALLMPIGSDCV